MIAQDDDGLAQLSGFLYYPFRKLLVSLPLTVGQGPGKLQKQDKSRFGLLASGGVSSD